jgi:hypothetical protein
VILQREKVASLKELFDDTFPKALGVFAATLTHKLREHLIFLPLRDSSESGLGKITCAS